MIFEIMSEVEDDGGCGRGIMSPHEEEGGFLAFIEET
jgi:hypothetical protein